MSVFKSTQPALNSKKPTLRVGFFDQAAPVITHSLPESPEFALRLRLQFETSATLAK